MSLLKPISDVCEYRHIKLENGIDAILIYDSETLHAAASLTVGAGQFHDPPEVQGLAHFLEHMLFLGTEKYPVESGFDEFCTSAAGYSNAYTSMNSTTYHWILSGEHMEEALDRFSSFFICPLMSASATEREMMAVDSEHCKNKQDDPNRFLQLERSTAKAGHPFNKFGTGCYESLFVMPKENNIDVREHLLAFYKKYYSARNMKLCVLGSNPLDEQEKWVRSMFSKIPDFEVNLPPVPAQVSEVFGDEWFGLYKIVPVKEKRELSFLWPLPPTAPHYQAKPHRFYSFTLGHEGKGSILYLLKEKGLAYELMAGSVTNTTEFSMFTVQIGLTPEGLDRYEEVVAIVYAYLNIIHSAPDSEIERVYNEVKAMADLTFRYKKKDREDNLTDEVSNNMIKFPIEHALAGPNIFFAPFDRKNVDEFYKFFDPAHLRLHLVAPENELSNIEPKSDNYLEEKWYGTKYVHHPISSAKLDAWKQTAPSSVQGLHLPLRNEFIATELSLREGNDNVQPELIIDEKGLKVYHKLDVSFRQPQTAVILALTSPLALKTAADAAKTRMILEIFEETANLITYDASEAGLEFRITNTSLTSPCLGLRLVSHGFSEKMGTLIKIVLQFLVKLRVDDDVFALIQRKTIDDYRNRKYSQPYSHSVNARNNLLQHPLFIDEQRLAEVEKMTADDLRGFVPQFFSSLLVETLLIGNLTKDEALVFVRENIQSQNIWQNPPSPTPSLKVTALSPTKTLRSLLAVPNEQDENSCILVHFQVGSQTLREDMLVEAVVLLLDQFLYTQLRTVEQLGYIVSTVTSRLAGVQGINVVCQSTRSPFYLEERVELAMAAFRQEIEGENGTEMITQTIKSLAQKKMSPERSIDERCEVLFQEIGNRSYLWDRKQKESEILLQLTPEEILQFYDTVFKMGGERRRKMVCMHFGREAIAGGDVLPENASSSIFLCPASSSPNIKDWIDQSEKVDLLQFKESVDKY